MSAEVIIGGISAGLATAIVIGIFYAIKAIAKGVEKTKAVAGFLKEELDKVDRLVERITYSENPEIGKVEVVRFHLSQADESLFYAIPPKYLKRLRAKLEKMLQSVPDTTASYGRQYAERQFWIGNQLIFSWKNEVKV